MTIFPKPFDPDLHLEQVTVTDEITVTLRATSPTAMCPDCGTISPRIQSRYCRMIHDLPHGGRPVHLVLQVRVTYGINEPGWPGYGVFGDFLNEFLPLAGPREPLQSSRPLVLSRS